MAEPVRYVAGALVGRDPWNYNRLIGYLVDGAYVYLDDYERQPYAGNGLFQGNWLAGFTSSPTVFGNGNSVVRSYNPNFEDSGRYWFSTDGATYTLALQEWDEELAFIGQYRTSGSLLVFFDNDIGDSRGFYGIDDQGRTTRIIEAGDSRFGDFVLRDDTLQFTLDAEGIPLDTFVTDGRGLWRRSEVDDAPTALVIDTVRTIESAEAGFVVAHLTATDSDARDRIFYRIVSDSTGGALALNGNALVIAAGQRLDWENDPQVTVVIRATDLAGNVIERSFTIDVLNVETNRPPVIISNGGGLVAEIGVGEREDVVTTVVAADPDPGTILTYAIAGGTDAGLFRIDAATGELRFRATTDYETPGDTDGDNVYRLTVSASDGVYGVSQDLVVTVLDRADGGEAIVATAGGLTLSSNGTANGSAGNDKILGSVRTDNIYGRAGDDVMDGGDGNDSLRGEAGADMLMGAAGDDFLDGGAGRDRMIGGPGNDLYIVDDAGDTVIERAGQGRDTVRSSVSWTLGAEFEVLEFVGGAHLTGQGNALDNLLRGNAGDNLLSGGDGRDILDGGAGWDVLVGGAGSDQLTGGAGADRFRFTGAVAGERDTITDFMRGVDRIELVGAGFGLAAGALDARQLTVGAVAATAATRLVYNPATATLSFDPDGNGAAAAIELARFAVTPTLAASDFTVI